MIPIAILYGLIGGLVPRYRWWAIPAIGVIWAITLSISGDPTMSFAQIWFGGLLLGALNAAVGVIFTLAIVKLIRLIRGPARESSSA